MTGVLFLCNFRCQRIAIAMLYRYCCMRRVVVFLWHNKKHEPTVADPRCSEYSGFLISYPFQTIAFYNLIAKALHFSFEMIGFLPDYFPIMQMLHLANRVLLYELRLKTIHL